eukprot:evm.model.NODE_48710_length_3732_cov_28.329849.1
MTKEMEAYFALLEKIKTMLEANHPIRTGTWTAAEVESVNDRLKDLITTKPMIYVVNLSQQQFIKKRSKWLPLIQEGALAPQAAGAIHTDFERGFIKAEVVSFDDYKAHNNGKASMVDVKAAGKYRIEGKAYVVQDGDIIHFQFNVTADKKKK